MWALESEYLAGDTRSICRSSAGRLLLQWSSGIGTEAVGYREHVRGCSLGFVWFLRHDGQRQTSGFVVHFMSTESDASGVMQRDGFDVLVFVGSTPERQTPKVERLPRAKSEKCQEDWTDPLSHT